MEQKSNLAVFPSISPAASKAQGNPSPWLSKGLGSAEKVRRSPLILLVSSLPEQLRSVEAALSGFACELVRVKQVAEATAMLRQRTADLVLTDVMAVGGGARRLCQ